MNLIIKSLNFSYKNEQVINDKSFNFKSGELNIMSGKSGTGKTTLLNIIAGLEKPDSGEINLNGRTLSNEKQFIKPEKRNIGFVFQDFALFPHLSVKSNIKFAGNSDETFFNTLVDRLSIANHVNKYPHELSGGQQQRVSIARALFSDPKILLMDEPVSNQDQDNKENILKIVSEFVKEKQIVCILVSHEQIKNLNDVEIKNFSFS